VKGVVGRAGAATTRNCVREPDRRSARDTLKKAARRAIFSKGWSQRSFETGTCCGICPGRDARGKADTASAAAKLIQRQQTADGAITMALVGSGESTVNPYFGCFAAEGLLAQYRSTRDTSLLRSALTWVDWYAAHQNPNGTIFDYKGHAGAWRSTADYDSSDSYAAVYLSLLRDLYRASRDAVWLGEKHASIRRLLRPSA